MTRYYKNLYTNTVDTAQGWALEGIALQNLVEVVRNKKTKTSMWRGVPSWIEVAPAKTGLRRRVSKRKLQDRQMSLPFAKKRTGSTHAPRDSSRTS